MIFLTFLEIYLMNNVEPITSLREGSLPLENSFISQDKDFIKEIIIICSFGLLIYLLLHQANQFNDFPFKFCMYNKVLFTIMIIDIIICLFFVSKHLINYNLKFI